MTASDSWVPFNRDLESDNGLRRLLEPYSELYID